MSFRVQAKQCATCIYKKSSPLDLKKLETQIADPCMEGHFKGFRVCHHSSGACCRGFWNRHKNQFDVGQLAQRLKFVVFVYEDKLKAKN